MNDEAERRTEPRISTLLQAVIDDDHYQGRVFSVTGFSDTGAFLHRPDNEVTLPVIGSVFQIQFSWPRESKISPISVEATVVRAQEDGVGIKFDIMA